MKKKLGFENDKSDFIACIHKVIFKNNPQMSLVTQNEIWYSLTEIKLTLTGISLLGTLTGNLFLIYAIFASRCYTSKFYIIILNITFSDIIFAFVVDPMTIFNMSKRIAERKQKIDTTDYIEQVLMFCFGIAAILNMAALNVDRYVLLKHPTRYRNIPIKYYTVILTFLWLFSLIISLQVITMRFSNIALVFSVGSVTLTLLLMLLTTVSFWRSFTTAHIIKKQGTIAVDKAESVMPKRSNLNLCLPSIDNIRKPSDTPSVTTIPGTVTTSTYETFQSHPPKITPHFVSFTNEKKILFGRDIHEKRILVTLIIVSFVFVCSYLPTTICAIYLKVCVKGYSCNPFTVYLLQTIIEVTIICSPMIRPTVFLFRLTNLKSALKKLFKKRNSRQDTYKCEL